MSEPGGRPGRQPWNKGLALTTTPSASTARRWMQAAVAEGLAERKTAGPDGKPGRPPVLYGLSQAGREKAAREPGLPLDVQLERGRRLENARKRRGMQRRAQKANAAGRKADKARRRLTVAAREVEEARAALLAAEMVARAFRALSDAGGDPSVLLPEEIDVLLETGCATIEDGQLAPASDVEEKFRQVCDGSRNPERHDPRLP